MVFILWEEESIFLEEKYEFAKSAAMFIHSDKEATPGMECCYCDLFDCDLLSFSRFIFFRSQNML